MPILFANENTRNDSVLLPQQCPPMDTVVRCQNNQWHVEANETLGAWQLHNETISNQPCNETLASLFNVVWDYSSLLARSSLSICHYNLQDEHQQIVGGIQLRSYDFHRWGTNWTGGGYPGYYLCRASRETCLFIKQ